MIQPVNMHDRLHHSNKKLLAATLARSSQRAGFSLANGQAAPLPSVETLSLTPNTLSHPAQILLPQGGIKQRSSEHEMLIPFSQITPSHPSQERDDSSCVPRCRQPSPWKSPINRKTKRLECRDTSGNNR